MIKSDDIITDGSTKWIMRDIRPQGAVPPPLPVGAIVAMAGTIIPDGYLLCDGSAISRTDYADLFDVTGVLYGTGDGSTTFNLPNMSGGRMLQGVVAGNIGLYVNPGLPNVTGSLVNIQAGGARNGTGAFALVAPPGKTYSENTSGNNGWVDFTFDAQRSNPIYGRSDTVQPTALNVRFFIKY